MVCADLDMTLCRIREPKSVTRLAPPSQAFWHGRGKEGTSFLVELLRNKPRIPHGTHRILEGVFFNHWLQRGGLLAGLRISTTAAAVVSINAVDRRTGKFRRMFVLFWLSAGTGNKRLLIMHEVLSILRTWWVRLASHLHLLT